MKAIVQDQYGSADVLELREVDRPAVDGDGVLVRVHASAANRADTHIMTGLPYMVRLMGFGLRKPKSGVRGLDVAGRVESVGPDVTEFKPGDEVFGWGTGTFAEYASTREDHLLPKPAGVSFEQAAALPIAGMTALQALRDKGQIQAGQTVLIIGAAGGVGSFAVQIAKAFGADVTAVCSTAKVDLVRSIGADHVIDYTREDFARIGQRYDLIVDIAGNRSLSDLRRVLAPTGTLVFIGGEGGGRLLGGTSRLLWALLRSPFGRQKLLPFLSVERKEDLAALKQLVEAGKVTPVIDRTYPLSETREAIRYLEAGHARGKVVITV
jgi:NADPH:quinone reductase-like Zn-dependent oxidoreductase